MGQLPGGSVIVSHQKTADIQRRTEAVKDQLIRKGLLAEEDVQRFLILPKSGSLRTARELLPEPD